MSRMQHEEEYLSIEDYIVKGEGFSPSPFYVNVVAFTHFQNLKYILYYTADVFYYNLLWKIRQPCNRSSITL